jgi:uncharacterized protein YeaO (DUF488 family)
MIKLKRIYDRPEITDGLRVLVDRLWPRGVRRSTANVDIWIKEVGPSDELRKWFAHEQEKFPEFKKRYARELKDNRGFNKLLALTMANETVTLLFSASDTQHNNAVVLWGALQHALLKEERQAEKMSKLKVVGR